MQEEKPFEILVVDDEPPICELLSRLGRTLFPEATFVNVRAPQETLTYIDEQADKVPRLILLDIDLNQSTSGLDLLPQLQERLKGKVPIIMFTSSVDQPTVKQAYEKGAIAYTRKPDDLQAWKQYVASLRTYWFETTRLPPTD